MKAYKYLPHRPPFVYLDEVEITESGRAGKGIRRVPFNEPSVKGSGFLPSVFIIEAMAQLSGIISGKEAGILAGVRDFEFYGPVEAGETLALQSRLESSFGGLYIFRCEAHASGKPSAAGKVVLQLK